MKTVVHSEEETFEILKELIKPEYHSIDKLKQYVLDTINASMSKRSLNVRKLAKMCFIQDYANNPRSYLRRVLNGREPLIQPVLDRLSCALELRADDVFPFKRIRKQKAYEIEERINSRDIRDDPLRKDYQWQSLGLLRCLELRDILYPAA